MTNCLASTGIDTQAPLALGLLLLVAGVVVVLVLRRNRKNRFGGTLGLVLIVALGAAAVVAGGAPAPARAAVADLSATASIPAAAADSAVAATPAVSAIASVEASSTSSNCAATTAAPEPTLTPTTPPTPTANPTESPATILPDRDVTFVSGGITFYASYRGPADGVSSVPAAVIIGGTGAIDRDGNAATLATQDYAWLADLLSAQGIASIRYDKVGTGATGLGPYAANSSAMLALSYDQLRVQPARDALSFLAAQPGVDASRLLLVGHSEGGAVALTVAHDPGSAPAPTGLALIEPAYTNILDILSRQFSEQMQGAVTGGAMTAADAATLTTWMNAGVDEIRAGTAPFPDPGPVPLPAAVDYTQVIQSAIESNIYGSDPAQMVVTHAFRTLYGQGYDAIDPASYASSITIPTLVTCGTKDFNTPCGDGTTGSGVIALANQFAPGVAQLVELPNVVHILRDVGGDDVPNLPDQLAYPFSTQLDARFSAFVASFAQGAAQ